MEKSLSRDPRGVSPVIGVILMVAVTVILAAVIGAFVLGLGDQIQQTSPSASFSFNYDSGSHINITHEGGQSIPSDQLYVIGPGVDTSWEDRGVTGDVRAGDGIWIDETTDFEPGDQLRVVWRSAGDGQSATLARFTVPE